MTPAPDPACSELSAPGGDETQQQRVSQQSSSYHFSMRELALLQHIYTHNRRLPDHVTVPPGDDMAAVRVGDGVILVTVDQLADGVHFSAADTPLEWIGRKAITRNLSDVAAMAALPVGAVAAACLPRAFGEDRANRLFEAMRATAEQYGCPLIGGDISVWDQPLLMTVTVLAEPGGVDPVLRSGAREGDVVCVTGRVGGAWAEDGGGGRAEQAPHLTFEPRVELARRIASIPGLSLHSMLDLSDGLAGDLARICEQSSVSAEIDADRLPLRPEAHHAARRDGRPAYLHGLTDGEDYELCFTLDPSEADQLLPSEIDGVPITRIGRILKQVDRLDEAKIQLRRGGRLEPMNASGWEHTA